MPHDDNDADDTSDSAADQPERRPSSQSEQRMANEDQIPERIPPYVIQSKPNEAVPLLSGPFRLIGPSEATLNADLNFRWSPSPAIEFKGDCAEAHFDIGKNKWLLASDAFKVDTLLTRAQPGPESSFVRGIVTVAFEVGDGPIDELRFSLMNFPDYIGTAIRCERGGWTLGRLEMSCDAGILQIDKISEASKIAENAAQDGGSVITHVGRWIPATSNLSKEDAKSTLEMLHLWLGFLRGSWAGPLFPEGFDSNGRRTWRQFAPWVINRGQQVQSWLPIRSVRDSRADVFLGFLEKWRDENTWREPLRMAIAWYVEANAPVRSSESRSILALIALEMLSWVLLVETHGPYSRTYFNNQELVWKLRMLLDHCGIPSGIPDHFTGLRCLCNPKDLDGPAVITYVRNALVHPKPKNREKTDSVDGGQRWECGQLTLQYLELVILAICGHSGFYRKRAWLGDLTGLEVRVPWCGGDS
jgi:hypothetical protein